MTDGQISKLVGEVWSQLPEDKRVSHMPLPPTLHWYDTNDRGCMLCIESIYAALALTCVLLSALTCVLLFADFHRVFGRDF